MARGFPLRDERGFTVTELSIAATIMVAVTLAIFLAYEFGLLNFVYLQGRADAQQDARTAVDLISRYVRMSEAVVYGKGDDLELQADSDDDGEWETLRFYKNGTALLMDATDGSVVTTEKLADNLRNGDIFIYYDSGGSRIIDQNEIPTKAKRINIKVIIDDNPSRPLGALTVETSVEMRNRQ